MIRQSHLIMLNFCRKQENFISLYFIKLEYAENLESKQQKQKNISIMTLKRG